MLEQIIQLVTILFLLSMLCERIADFTKHYLCGNNVLGIGDTITKGEINSEKEEVRYYRILKINIWCGIITALILKADLVKILNNATEAGKTIGWDKISEYNILDIFLLPLGIVLTGYFISFGSKLWHDLLDILLEIKNTKRAINEVTVQQKQTDFEKLDSTDKDLVLRSAIQQLSKHWEATITGYKGVDVGKKSTDNVSTGNDVLRFYVEKKEYIKNIATPVPEFILFNGYKIPTDVAPDSGEMEFHNWLNPGDGRVPVAPGKSISRKNNKLTGTISLKVKKKIGGIDKFYALSCFHVLFNNEFIKGRLEIPGTAQADSPKNIKVPGDGIATSGTSIGTVGWGRIDEFVDAGVAELDNDSFVTEDIDGLGVPEKVHTVIAADVDKLRVSFCGAKSGLVKDILVRGCHADKRVDLPFGTIKFIDLIKLRKCSESGDSGAPVVDEYKRLIGIITGADREFTYIIPMQSIINRLKITPILKTGV